MTASRSIASLSRDKDSHPYVLIWLLQLLRLPYVGYTCRFKEVMAMGAFTLLILLPR